MTDGPIAHPMPAVAEATAGITMAGRFNGNSKLDASVGLSWGSCMR